MSPPQSEDLVAWVDERTGGAKVARKAMRYVFPDHWSFLLGEIALYAFLVLIGTGIYLALFFVDSTGQTVYHGAYQPLDGFHMSQAYASVLHISWDVKAGLLIRQTHHWAANVFVAAIVLHLLRIFFTGAFRKPRELTWVIGLLMLGLALPEGYLGYSLVDDLLSGMGLVIGYGVAESLPFVGGNFTLLFFGDHWPGDPGLWSRMYILHVLVIPIAIATLIAVHLALVVSRHHTQFKRKARQTERRLLGNPTIPSYAPKSLGLLFAVVAVLFLLGGLVQINPIWEWGPFETARSTNAAQPDWYLGWLIGALRLVPGWDWVIGDYTVAPNPFWGGALFPLIVFGALFAYPWIERRRTGDRLSHNLLDRPRDVPGRTAFGAAFFTWVALVFVAGSADRAFVFFGIGYTHQIWVYRVIVFVAPVVAFLVTRAICRGLQRKERIAVIQEQAEREAREAARAGAGVGGP